MAFEDLGQHGALVVAVEETLAGQRFPEHDRRCIDVRLARRLSASELFGDSSAAFRAVSQAWTAVGVN